MFYDSSTIANAMDHIEISPVNVSQQQGRQIESQTHISLCVICKQPVQILQNNDQQISIGANWKNINEDKKIVCLQCQKFYNESIELSIHSKFKCICDDNVNDAKSFDHSLHCDYCRFNRINQLRSILKSDNNSSKITVISESRCRRIETITGGYAGRQSIIYHTINNDDVNDIIVKKQPPKTQQQTVKHRINFLSSNSLSMFPFISQTPVSTQQSNTHDSLNPMIVNAPKSNSIEHHQQIQQSSTTPLSIQSQQCSKYVNSILKKTQSTTVNNKNGPNKSSKLSNRTSKKNFGQQRNVAKYRLLANKPEKNKQPNDLAILDCSMNDKFQSNRFTNFSLVQNPVDLDRKLSEALAGLDSNRISKYRCPLEELFHNWTFFIDHISMIYWSCFGPNQLRIELFIKKFWSFMNDFLCLYRCDQINDHAVIALVKSIQVESNISINQILLLNICWLKFGPYSSHRDSKSSSHPWWITIKPFLSNIDNDTNKKSKLLTEALDNIGSIADRFHINDIELALVSTILLLKHCDNQSIKMMTMNDNVACHVCHRPMFRLQQLFVAMLELFVDDHQQLNNVNDYDSAGLSNTVSAGHSGSTNGSLTQLMLFLSPELEYFFALLNA
uniref:Uncharacterized protein LOC113799804 isoform X2 n=1 Tax=Dermatophagoides pteronyssinus TaxID=6956 RepID=A0A6P6YN31_DERPT|nr:uncharacterized protein LOC113799804 isoform X2 [Dermatophagoides pteronyssinus]